MILALLLIGPSAWGQTTDSTAADKAAAAARQEAAYARVDTRPYQTFYLANATQQNDANEVVIAVRNMVDPNVKIYLVPSQNAIAMRGTPDQLALAQKVINDIDRPKKAYRLTYSISEMEGGSSPILTSG
jgi:type II secretory pathway component GspD/PulD (secretin)